MRISLVKSNPLIKGAIWLAAGTFIAKFIGAFYRVPLTNLLGGEGLGIYQTVFPVYLLLLDISGSGLPSAISKIVASFSGKDEMNKQKSFLKSCFIILGVAGFIGAGIMATLSGVLSTVQGDVRAATAYLTLAPSVFFVSLISCFRGYFQGKEKMSPTAVSQVIEQTVKLIFGIILVKAFLPDIQKAVSGATLAVTFSEVVGFIYLFITYKVKEKGLPLSYKQNLKVHGKELIKYGIPVTLSGIMIPLSHIADSFMIVNILSVYREDATSLYGLLTGASSSVINLPVAVCYGIAVAAIPYITKAKKDIENKTNFTVIATFFLSFIGGITVFLFAPFMVNILFSGMASYERGITVFLIRGTAVNVVLISLIQTGSAILTGAGKPNLPVISLFLGVVVKVILNFLLLPIRNLNIYGGAISSIACYFTAVLLNFIWLKVKVKENAVKRNTSGEYAS